MPIRILVVDDETAVTDLIGYNLEKAHYQVITAHDGETALELARKSKPDLVLLDLMLPKIDGIKSTHTFVYLDAQDKWIEAKV